MVCLICCEALDEYAQYGVCSRCRNKEEAEVDGEGKTMRCLKFRAWDKSGGKWLGGDQFKIFPNGGVEGWDEEGTIDGDLEIVQFTGLLDCVGKEIYEGDIVTFEVSNYKNCLMFGYIEWWKNIFMVGIHRYKWMNQQGEITSGKEIGSGGFPLHTILLSSIKVIGNIYEHPKLLEGAK